MALDYNDITFRKEVWKQGVEVEGYSPDMIRKNAAGAWIIFDRFSQDDPFGWQIDHVCPKKILEENGIKEEDMDAIEDLRPFNTANNEKKGDEYPNYTRAVFYNERTDKNEEDGRSPYIVNRQVQKKIMKYFGLPITLFGDGHKKTAIDISQYLESK